MNVKKILAIWAATFLITTMFASIIVSGDSTKTNIYVVPQTTHIEIGNTSYVRLLCNTTQAISGWGFQYIYFTQGIINVSKVKIGTHFAADNDYYIFEDNGTMHGHGLIYNTTGQIGGSWASNYTWEATSDGGWINNTNRTVFNLTIKAMKCGQANITIYSNNGQYFAFSGIPVDYTYHLSPITVHPAKATSFTATAYLTQINLSWVKGPGANRTVIRGKLGSYPTSVIDGTWGANITSQAVNHTTLDSAQHWYYRAWSWNGTKRVYSLTNAVADATTAHIPTAYLIIPKNQSIDVNKQPKCRIWANDTAGGTLTINFYENTTGTPTPIWVRRQKNASVTANTTVQWNYSQASSYSTKYWWKVTIYDGITNISRLYYFTTKSGPHVPTTYLIAPKNQSTGLNKQPNCEIWANDTAGGTLAVTFYENSTGSWIQRQQNPSVPANSTVQWNYSQATSLGTKYYWKVTLDDGTTNSSNTYYLTTKTAPHVPTTYLITPKNQSTNLNKQPKCRIWANDTAGGTLTVNFYENSTGSWIKRQLNSSVPANSTVQWNYTQATAYSTKYWWKTTIDDSMANISRLYYFTTKSGPHVPTAYLITPKNQSIDINKQPKCRIRANDSAGGTLTINFYENSTGGWIKRQINSSVAANATVQWNYSQALSYSTKYWWKATIYDGTTNITRLYYFTIKAAPSHIPTTYLIIPKNQSVSINHQPKCRLWANDTAGGTLSTNWYSSDDGLGFVHRQKNASIASNSTTQWNYTQAISNGTTYYWKSTIDDGTTNISRTYYFTTKGMNRALNTNIYVIPGSNDIELGNTSSIRLRCNTRQAISGWGFEYINFTQGIINVSKVKIGSHYTDDSYMFKDNSTMHGHGTINNATGVIGGSWVNYFWEATADGGWINNTNRTIINLTIKGMSCGRANITIYSSGGQYFAFSGIPVDYTYHLSPLTVHPAKAISFMATAYLTQINLSWVKGPGANRTVIRGKLGSLPTSVTDGTWGVNTTAQRTNHTGLTASQHWYYRAWSWNGTKRLYSLTNAIGDATIGTAAHVPTTYLISPKNQSTNVNKQPRCRIWANDTHGGPLQINWYSSTDGISFTHRQKNTSVAANATYQWNYSQAVLTSTTYYWKVTAYDGTTNVSNVFWFTIKSAMWHNITRMLYFNASAGGGLNFFSAFGSLYPDASHVAIAIGPSCAQVICWYASNQSWSDAYIPGVGGPNFVIHTGDSIGVEVTANVTIPITGTDSNSVRTLYYNGSAGGGLNWLGRTDDTNLDGDGPNIHASDISSHVSPSCASQIIRWNETVQRYQQFIIGVDTAGGPRDFQIKPGFTVAIEVTANAILTQYGW
jgi:ribosomal protein L3